MASQTGTQVTKRLVAALAALAAVSLLSPAAAAVDYPRYANMGSEAAVALADTILSWQLENGGWGKNLPTLERAWTPGTPKSDQLRGGVELGSFDNGATTSELRFLAGVYAATGEPRFREAVLRGIEFILEAQYEGGGWPQVYPSRGNYSDYVTFNDNAMVRVMELVRDAAERRPPFDFLPEEYEPRLKEAFDRGVEYILNAQIEVGGRLTGWCQQHDPVTYAPRPGRAYEHVSISGSETVGIVRLLMSLPDPSERVRTAILSALMWLEEARLPDGRWARFYEIGTNRPIFSGRDGVIKYDIMEIEAERREGYAWYGTWPSGLLAEAKSTGYFMALHASLPGYPAPALSVSYSSAPAAARMVSGPLAIDVEISPGGAVEMRRLSVTLGGFVVFDGHPVHESPAGGDGPESGGAPGTAGIIRRRFDVDTFEVSDGWHELAVELTYALPGEGGGGERAIRFAETVQVRNRWTRSIAMRPPQNQGWFGTVDQLGTSDRSEGWAFLTSGADRFFGDRDRIAWQGEGVGFLEWEAPRLREVRLVAFVRDEAALEAIRFKVSGDREAWSVVDYAVVRRDDAVIDDGVAGLDEAASGGDVVNSDRADGRWRRVELVAAPASDRREIRWFRIEVDSSEFQLGQLDLAG